MFRYLKAMEAFTQKTPDLVLNIYFEDMLKVCSVATFITITQYAQGICILDPYDTA